MGIRQQHIQPDGGLVEIDSDVLRVLTQGDQTLGWEGDDRLYLAWNRQDQRIELWRNNEDGVHRMILRGPVGQRVADMRLVQFLLDHDPNRGFDPAASVRQHNIQVRKDNLAAQRDRTSEAAERLLWGFHRDLDI